MKGKIFFGLVILLSLCSGSAMAQSNGNTYQDGYNRGYGFGRSNDVDAIQNFTTQYLRAVEGDEVGYAQGMQDGLAAGLAAGGYNSLHVNVQYSGGGGSIDEGGYSTWLYDLVSDGFAGTGVLVV